MKSIYLISGEFRDLIKAIENNDGEVSPELEQLLTITKEELQKKAVDYGYYIKEADATSEIIDKEIDRLKKLKERNEKFSNGLKERITKAMLEFGVEKVESDTLTLSFRKSTSVVIDDENALPEDCFETKRVVIKAKVKELLKIGALLGAHEESKKNLQIK